MNFHAGQFFTQGFFGVNVPGRADDRYEWMKQCNQLVDNRETPCARTPDSPPNVRWMK